MTTECALNGAAVTPTSMPPRVGAVFSTAQLSSRSYLRVFNTGASAGVIDVILRDQVSGQSYGAWTSPFVNPGAEQPLRPLRLPSADRRVTAACITT